jgi:hypothetical protein
MNVRLRWMMLAGLVALATLVVACGSEPNAAPASQPATPVVSPTPGPLSELVALRIALERKNRTIYSESVGEPSRVWGAPMTYGEASILRHGEPINPQTSEYERRNDLVWYFVLEGQVITHNPGAPGGTPQPDPVAELSIVGMALDAFTGSIRLLGASAT